MRVFTDEVARMFATVDSEEAETVDARDETTRKRVAIVVDKLRAIVQNEASRRGC